MEQTNGILMFYRRVVRNYEHWSASSRIRSRILSADARSVFRPADHS
ncbi:hypothetical protein ACFYPC_27170 [Streptomyces sp. NPDC005808]